MSHVDEWILLRVSCLIRNVSRVRDEYRQICTVSQALRHDVLQQQKPFIIQVLSHLLSARQSSLKSGAAWRNIEISKFRHIFKDLFERKFLGTPRTRHYFIPVGQLEGAVLHFELTCSLPRYVAYPVLTTVSTEASKVLHSKRLIWIII